MAASATDGGGGQTVAGPFDLPGDPGSIRMSASGHKAFATVQQGQADVVRATRFTSWVGSEGETFVQKKDVLPPLMERASSAFTGVARALTAFADILETEQKKMRAVADQHAVEVAGCDLRRTGRGRRSGWTVALKPWARPRPRWTGSKVP